MSWLDDFPPDRSVGQAAVVAAIAAVAGVWLADLPRMEPAMASGMLLPYLVVGLPIAVAHAILLGVPLYIALRGRWRLRWWNAALIGGLIGMIPATLLTFFEGSFGAGVLPGIAKAGFGGTLGGFSFRAMLRRSGSCR